MNDYSKKIHEAASEIGKELLPLLLENATTIIPSPTGTPEERKALEEQTLDFGNKVVQFLATKDIPARYATMGIEKLIDALNGLKTFVNGTLTMYEDEYLSRMFGIKNADGKYRREEATVADLVMKLEEAKQATGNNRADFFNDVAPEMPKPDEAIPSPFMQAPENPDENHPIA